MTEEMKEKLERFKEKLIDAANASDALAEFMESNVDACNVVGVAYSVMMKDVLKFHEDAANFISVVENVIETDPQQVATSFYSLIYNILVSGEDINVIHVDENNDFHIDKPDKQDINSEPISLYKDIIISDICEKMDISDISSLSKQEFIDQCKDMYGCNMVPDYKKYKAYSDTLDSLLSLRDDIEEENKEN